MDGAKRKTEQMESITQKEDDQGDDKKVMDEEKDRNRSRKKYTILKRNKARYTATPVAQSRAGRQQ